MNTLRLHYRDWMTAMLKNVHTEEEGLVKLLSQALSTTLLRKSFSFGSQLFETYSH